MGGIISKPKVPTPISPTPVPTLEDAQQASDEAVKDDLKRRKGRAANILSTGDDSGGTAQTTAKRLLG